MLIFAPLSGPTITGLVLTTLILYPAPGREFIGIVATILPESAVVGTPPMITGVAKLPVEEESSAVKMLPAPKGPTAL